MAVVHTFIQLKFLRILAESLEASWLKRMHLSEEVEMRRYGDGGAESGHYRFPH